MAKPHFSKAPNSAPFEISDTVYRATQVKPHQREDRHEPVSRPLKVFTTDPSLSKFRGSVATVLVPYEELDPGPIGSVLEILIDPDRTKKTPVLNLDDPRVLIAGGISPSATNENFRHQMVYAVAMRTYQVFRLALGRYPHWCFDGEQKLKLFPKSDQLKSNAYYNRNERAIRFGHFKAGPNSSGRNIPNGEIYTSLHHDIIVHETAHALLDGLRPHFMIPTNRDVLAFHEGFSDIVAVFQHFAYKDVVVKALKDAGGKLRKADVLTDLARQFGQTRARHNDKGISKSLRTAIDDPACDPGDKNCRTMLRYDDASDEPHELGSVLLTAVFEAFDTIFERKSRGLVRLASSGTGVLPDGELPDYLVEMLAETASTLAKQFLSICIRAIDYCPPVDLTFGDYLRALVTADYELVPNDELGYREAFVDAFSKRNIFPSKSTTLSEESLLWEQPVNALTDERIRSLRFPIDPSSVPLTDELYEQAMAIGQFVTASPENFEQFHLKPYSVTDRVSKPEVQSVRIARQMGPDGRILFGMIAEITQTRTVNCNGSRYSVLGGSTIIIGSDSKVKYVIRKSTEDKREQTQLNYVQGEGNRFWNDVDSIMQPIHDPVAKLHSHRNHSEL